MKQTLYRCNLRQDLYLGSPGFKHCVLRWPAWQEFVALLSLSRYRNSWLPQIKPPWPLPSTSLSINYSLNFSQLYTIQSELITVSLNKRKKISSINLTKTVDQLTAKLSSIQFLGVVFVSPNSSVFSKELAIRLCLSPVGKWFIMEASYMLWRNRLRAQSRRL